MKSAYFIFLCVLFQWNYVHAQNTIGFSGSAHYGFTIAHTERIENLKSTNPIGIQFDIYKLKADKETYDVCNCYTQSGLSLAVFDYGNNDIVGQGIHTNFYIEPQFKLWKSNYFILRGTAGVSFMNRPYDAETNPNNLAYSLPVSGFVSFGPGMRTYFGKEYSAFILFPFNHVSNGGIKDPNLGLNFPGVHLGLSKDINGLNRYDGKSKRSEFSPRSFMSYTAFWSSRTVQNGEKKRYMIYGVDATYSYQFKALWSVNTGIEFYRDDAVRERIKREQGIDEVRYRSGLMAGIGIHLGRFELTHRLGVYVYDPDLYNGRFFHRHGLMYAINKHWLAGIQIKAHKEVANFLDFRASYRW